MLGIWHIGFRADWQTRDANFASHPDSTVAHAAFPRMPGVVPWRELSLDVA